MAVTNRTYWHVRMQWGLPMSACRRADRQRGRSRIHHTSDGPEHPACSKRAHGLRWQKRWRRDGDAPPPSLSAIGCICGDSFSFEAAALAAASALTLPAGARTWTLGHRGSERGQASIRVGKHHWGRAGASVSIRWDSTVHSARVAPIGGISWGLQLQPRFEDN